MAAAMEVEVTEEVKAVAATEAAREAAAMGTVARA